MTNKNWVIEEKVDTLSKRIRENESKVPQNYGICSQCKNFFYRKTKLMDEECICIYYFDPGIFMKTRPNSYDPITECSGHYPRGQISINEMVQIAYIIDINRKRKIGFEAEEAEVIVSTPEEREENK